MNHTNSKVSVIIPVYNAEEYLRKCLDSVITQTLKNIEIICVNDGSTDGSLQIIEEYADRDTRIRVINKENGGLVSARKAGIAAATGQYIGYVDSDDWIDSEMYGTLYDIAVNNDAEMVCSGYFFEGNYVTVHYDGVPKGLYDENNISYLRENAIYNTKTKDVGLRGSLCCKLFRTELLQSVQTELSEKLSFSEDKMCVISCILRCSRVYVLKQAFYHYIMHPSSMVHKANAGYLLRVNEVYQHFIKLYGHPAFTSTMRTQAEIYITELLYKGINGRLGFKNRNLFWLDPYYLENIPANSRVVLYGGGELAAAYQQQLIGRKDLQLVGCVDPAYEKIQQDGMNIHSPSVLKEWEYDLVLITVKNHGKADEIRKDLWEMGVAKEKIYWYEQKEIYWKYAEVNGWLL